MPRDICLALKTGTQLIHGSHRTFNLSIKCLQDDERLVLQRIMQSHIPPFKPSGLLETLQPPVTEADDKLTIQTAMDAIAQSQKRIGRPYVFLPEIGSSFFFSFKLPTSATSINRGWLSNPWYGAMGTSLPYARVVSRALKRNNSTDLPLVIMGDGGLHFQLNELIHFQREHLSVLILLFRNNIFGLGKSSNSSIYKSCTPEFNVIKMIEAYGGKGITCSSTSSFREALDGYSAAGTGLMLIEISLTQDQDNQLSMINETVKSRTGCRTGAII